MNITGNDPAAGAEHTGYRWVGTSVPRREDPRFLTGRGGYVGDITVPGMLHGAVLRSPHAHARIRSIDTSAARALPGVVAVLTGEEALAHVNPMPAFCAEPVPQHAITVETGALPRRGGRRGRGHRPVHRRGRVRAHRGRLRAAPAGRRPRRGDGRRRPPRARDAGGQRGVPPVAGLRRCRRRLRPRAARGAQDGPLAPDGRPADRDRRGDLLVRPLQPGHDRLVELELLQLPALGLRRHAGRAQQPAAHDPLRGRGQLRQQALHHQGDRDRRGPEQACRATGEVRRGPDGQHRGQRQRRLRPHLRRRARAVGRRRDARADPEDHRRLRGLLPVRARAARQRHVPADRPVPHRQPALRRLLRADQQGPAGLLPRRGRRPGQLHSGTAGRRGRGGTGH